MAEKRKGIPKAALLGVGIFTVLELTSCDTPKTDGLDTSLPSVLTGPYTKTMVPSPAIQKLVSIECGPPDLSYDQSLAHAEITADEASHSYTLTITPGENLDTPFSITITGKKNMGIFGIKNCQPNDKAVFTAQAQIDTKDTECVVTSSEGQNANLHCNEGGGVKNITDGTQAWIGDGGNTSIAITNPAGEAQLVVTDSSGNTSELLGVLETECSVPNNIRYSDEAKHVVGDTTCNRNANILSTAGGNVDAVPNQPVQVNIDGADNATTVLTVQHGPLQTQTMVTVGVQNPPDMSISEITIKDSQDWVTAACKSSAYNAPCAIGNESIPVGTEKQVAVGKAILNNHSPITVPISGSDSMGRVVTFERQQQDYAPFDSAQVVQAFFDNVDGTALHVTINTGDGTESISRVLVRGTQDAPFTPQNIIHLILEEMKGTEVKCEEAVRRPTAPQVFDSVCQTPHGKAGTLDLNVIMADNAGNTQTRPINIYNTTNTQGPAERIEQPYYPSALEVGIDVASIAIGVVASLRVGAMVKNKITDLKEAHREKKTEQTFDLLKTSCNGGQFELIENDGILGVYVGDKKSLAAKIDRNIYEIKGERQRFALQLWERKKRNIILSGTPAMISIPNKIDPVFNSKVLSQIITQKRTDQELKTQVESLPPSQKKIKDVYEGIETEEQLVVRRVFLKQLNTYLGTTIHTMNEEKVEVSAAALNSDLTLLVTQLLQTSDQSWIWKLIQKGEGSEIPFGKVKSFEHISKSNILAIIFAQLINSNYNNFMDYKKLLQGLFGKEFTRAKAEEMGNTHYILVR